MIGGGSTTVEGPKNDGTAPEMVMGVFKSPGAGSGAAGSPMPGSPATDAPQAGAGLPSLSEDAPL